METHRKIRLDILIEAPLKNRLADLLEEHGVSGYTIFSAVGGRGETNPWARAGLITDVGQMFLFITILDAERLQTILDVLFADLAGHIGFVTTSEVQVIRPAKFP